MFPGFISLQNLIGRIVYCCTKFRTNSKRMSLDFVSRVILPVGVRSIMSYYHN